MIYSIGEVLIDLMQEGNSYVPYPGGAPANVAIHAKRSGASAAFVGKISEDNFGKQLKGFLEENEVYFPLSLSPKATTLALVSHVDGDRSFQFYRNNTADLDLSPLDIVNISFKPKDILHFCSLGLVDSGSTYQAHLLAIQRCKQEAGIVSFDVNLREPLWNSLELAKERTLRLLSISDLIKVNEEELLWLSGIEDIKEALKSLQTKNQLIICTRGKEGSLILTSDQKYIEIESPSVEQVDTTGAGDSYIAMILSSLEKSNKDFKQWQDEDLKSAAQYAANISAQVVSKQGAIPKIKY